MGGSGCRGLCDIHRYAWRQPLGRKISESEGGRYTNAFLCRPCKVWVYNIFAQGRGENQCPCCNRKMRAGRATARTKKAQRLGYDPRDKFRIE